MTLSEKEIMRLKNLYKDSFAYLARDKDGRLFAYRKWDRDTLVKCDSKWKCKHYCKVVESTLCKFIRWEAVKPTSIEELMKEVK